MKRSKLDKVAAAAAAAEAVKEIQQQELDAQVARIRQEVRRLLAIVDRNETLAADLDKTAAALREKAAEAQIEIDKLIAGDTSSLDNLKAEGNSNPAVGRLLTQEEVAGVFRRGTT